MNLESVRGKRVWVGLSGGVDSAVAALLLKKAGALVTGVFIKGWYPPGLPCTWALDRRDAMRVASRLHVPFLTLDAAAEYKQGVIDYLLAEYKAGRTPNPDVMCNREVKFGAFYRYALGHGADAIATGHYLSGEKDQRYFLWAVPKEALALTIFPLKEREKPEVRALAKAAGLPVAKKPDSQGICFLGPVSVEDFLISEFGHAPGEALDEAGNRVGAHSGAILYTIGERVALARGPWYVVAKDIASNTLTIGHEPASPASLKNIPFGEANWLDEHTGEITAQYRYRGPYIRGHLSEMSNTECPPQLAFEPLEPLPEQPAAGQSLVFYKNDELLGGGIIAA